MRVNTLMPYLYTGTYMDYTETQDEASGDVRRTFFDAGPVACRVLLTDLKRVVLYTDLQMRPFARVQDIRDQKGVEIIEGGVFEIKDVLPVLNAFGFSDGYQYRVSQVA